MDEHIVKGAEATNKMVEGARKLCLLVQATLGPDGKHVFLEHPSGTPISSKDGATVSSWIHLEDKFENLGANVVKFAAAKTASQAGDATTTTTILAENYVRNGVKAVNNGSKAREVITGMEIARDAIVKTLSKRSKAITPKSPMVNKVALVSSNYDKPIADMISWVVKDAGRGTIINIEKSLGGETTIDYQKGMTVQSSYAHPVFMNTNHNECILENVLIVICDYEVSKIKEIGHIFATIEGSERSPGPRALMRKDGARRRVGSFLFIAKDVVGEAMSSLAKSKAEGGAAIAIAKAPYGDDFNELIRDIAIFTGGNVVAENEGQNMEQMNVHYDCGWAEKIILTRDSLTILEGDTNENELEKRLERLSHEMGENKGTPKADVYRERSSRLTGSVAKMVIGGENEAKLTERADRAEDAVHAVRSAMEEGIVPGGGVSWLRAAKEITEPVMEDDQQKGYDTVVNACIRPITVLLENSGYSSDEISSVIDDIYKDKDDVGFNALIGEIEDLTKAGIVDPVKVLRCAIENAVMVASQIMNTGSIMYVVQKS